MKRISPKATELDTRNVLGHCSELNDGEDGGGGSSGGGERNMS